jgi:hypothetical protein
MSPTAWENAIDKAVDLYPWDEPESISALIHNHTKVQVEDSIETVSFQRDAFSGEERTLFPALGS